ncbi:MAG TPA: CmpA/NrtA family ABC transporter substrate-binding protein [Parvibaculum sp.]|jgi:NitT/TauT family transport system ATP-binding protein/nitrate/nitrite transport system substrate-binding protein
MSGTGLRIGLLRLTDAAPVITAHEFGFFAEEGLDVELSVEPSWANIADKLAFGFLDAAVIVPPLAFAITLGLRGMAQPLVIPHILSLSGNMVTLKADLAAKVRAAAAREGSIMPQALATVLRADKAEPLTLGIVHAYSTHNLLLRYWLAAGGIDLQTEVKLTVVPPAQAVEALSAGQIAGFCAGAPWGDVAERAGVGAAIAASKDIWQNAPEKAFAVRSNWAEDHPEALQGALRALLRAARFCDAPENASYTGALLSRRKYLNVDAHAILSSLPGGAAARAGVSSFYRNAATFPWRSHALWFLQEMKRWGLLDPAIDTRVLAMNVYRPDLYRSAATSLDLPAPLMDVKSEGAHASEWQLATMRGPIDMGPDLFCDGAIFEPGSREDL